MARARILLKTYNCLSNIRIVLWLFRIDIGKPSD